MSIERKYFGNSNAIECNTHPRNEKLCRLSVTAKLNFTEKNLHNNERF